MPLFDSHPPLGYLRTWFWRGWRIRYAFLNPTCSQEKLPILLIHGFGASLGHWRHNLSVLGRDRPVYAIDLLGFGASEKAAAPYNPLFWAELIDDFCQTFIGRPLVLGGNSLGSVVCMTVAARYPDLVQGLVLINLPDASVLAADRPPLNAQKLSRCLAPLVAPLAAPLGHLLQTFLTSPLVINPLLAIVRSPGILYPALGNAYVNRQFVDEELRRIISEPTRAPQAAQALRFLTRGMGNLAPDYRARRVLPQLKIPLLLIWGKQDRLVPPGLGPRCARLNPQVQLVELDQAGHCPQDECADRVNQLILEWLGAIEGEGDDSERK